jgi:hypothetical protein
MDVFLEHLYIKALPGPEDLERGIHPPAKKQQPAVFIWHGVFALRDPGKFHCPVPAVQVG